MNNNQRNENTMIARRSGRLGFVFVILLSACSLFAQIPPIDDIAPPPLRTIAKEEITQLNAITDVKKRTKLSLELMEARIAKAEQLSSREDFEAMFKELGGFHGLMENTLMFLSKSDKDKGKVLNNFKRLELGLRTFAPRLELIRRDLPIRYERYLRTLAKYVRDARSRALDPFFADTVVPNKRT